MNLLAAMADAIRLPELRNKLLFTGGVLVVFRLFANVAVPGASQAALSQLFNSQALLGLLNLFSGGGLSRFSVVAMGLNPFINATIIMQLMTVISERIKEISKDGEAGRRRIQRWSRFLTVALGAAVLGVREAPQPLPSPAAAPLPCGRPPDHIPVLVHGPAHPTGIVRVLRPTGARGAGGGAGRTGHSHPRSNPPASSPVSR